MTTWNFVQKAPKHWDSIIPHGYFIVIETNDDGDDEYVVYKGHYDDWRLKTGAADLKMLQSYPTLPAAKKHKLG